MNEDKMELEEAKRIMEEWSSSYYKEVGENDDSLVIDTVLQALQNSIPKKKIEDRLQELLNKLASAGLDGFYDEVKDIEQELLEDK